MEHWNLGPDNLYPATSYTATKLDEAVSIRNDPKFYQLEPLSIYSRFKQTVDKHPRQYALAFEINEKWEKITFEEYWQLCLQAAKSFIKLNLRPSRCVAILGFNAPAWMISMYGAIFAGGIGCGVYTTNSAEVCEHILKDSEARIVVVENQVQLDKILKCRETCQIDKIIMYNDEIKNNHGGLVISWQQFMDLGNTVLDLQLQDRIRTIAPNKCASLIYTSGTTGMPKAVMISHDSVVYIAKTVIETANFDQPNERLVSYLPLSHIAAQIIDLFLPAFCGAVVYFARPDALKGTLAQTISHVRPTIFFGVPRVWEKMEDKINDNIRQLSKLKMKLFKWSTKIGLEHIEAGFHNETRHRVKYWIADKLVLNKIRSLMGLDQARLVYTGAAPTSRKTLEFFMGFGLPLCEVFGMSECGPHIFGLPHRNRITSVGYTKSAFNATRIITDESTGNGELCMYGRHVFMGYLNCPSKTQETIDPDGCLHSGDIARVDEDGYLYITGRLKELIITAGGENVGPVAIEDGIKAELPQCISNCMVVGDKRKFLTVLVTLKCLVDLDTMEPMDVLTDECKQHLQKLGSNAQKPSDVFRNKSDPIYKEIDSAIKRANSKAISNAAKVQKFTILPKDFSLPGGELGPTLKLRRLIVNQKYHDLIEEMYKENVFTNPTFSEK